MNHSDLNELFIETRNRRDADRFRQEIELMPIKSLEAVAAGLYVQLQIHQQAIAQLSNHCAELQRQNELLMAQQLGFGLDYQDRLIARQHPEM